MTGTDWNFDFSSLPKYDTREKLPFVYDRFFEIAESDALCGIYSIVEASMLNYIGALILLKNKEEPRVLLNVFEEINFTDNFSRSKDGRYIFLQANIWDDTNQRIDRPIIIFDLLNELFAVYKTPNHNTTYEIVEIKKGVFQATADETQKKHDKQLRKLTRRKIRLKWQSWRRIEEFGKIIRK